MNNSELTTNVKVRGAEEAARKIQGVREKVEGVGEAGDKSTRGLGSGSAAANGFMRALSAVGSAAASFATRIAGVAWGAFKTGIITATTAIVGLGTKGLMSASQIQSLQISMNGLTGSMEAGSRAMATAYEYAQKAPFQLPDVAQTTKGLIAMGVEVDKTGALLETIGGIAITSGAQITDIGRIYGQVFATGKLQLEDMNQLTDNGVGIQKALEKQLGVSSEQVRKMATDGKISFEQFNTAMKGMVDPAILEQLNNTLPRQIDRLKGSIRQLSNAFVGFGVDATNGAQMASNGLAQAATNMTKALADALRTDELKARLADIGNGLVPAVQMIQEQIPNIISVIASLAAPIASTFSGLIGTVTAFIQGAAPGLEAFFNALNTSIVALQPVLAQVGQQLGDAFTKALAALAPAIAPLAQALAIIAPVLAEIVGLVAVFAAELIGALAPILPPIAQAITMLVKPLIEGLRPMLPIIVQAIGQLAQAFIQILSALMPLLPPLMQLAMTILQQLLMPLLPAIIQLVQLFANVITMVLNAIMPILPPLMQLATTLITALAPILPMLVQLFIQLVNALMPLLPPLLEVITILLPPLITLLNIVAQVITIVSNVMSAIFVGAISAVIQVITLVITWISRAQSVINALASVFWGAVNAILGAVSGGLTSVVNFFVQLPGRILGALGNLGNLLVGAGKNVVDGLVRGIGGARDAVVNKVTEIAKGALDAIKNFFGIKSPSRVMAGMGTYMMQGLQNGIEGMRSAVVGTANSVSEAVADGFTTDVPDMNMPGSAAAAYYNTYGPTTPGTADAMASRAATAVAAANGANGGADGTIQINFHGPVYMRDEEEINDVGAQLGRQLQAARAGAY